MARNPFGNSFAMNPYRLTGLPSLNTLDKKYSGDLTKLTKPQFEQMTRDKQNTNIRQAFSMFSQFPPSEDTTMNMPNSFTSSPSSFRSMSGMPSLSLRNPLDPNPMNPLQEKKGGGKLDALRGLLSGGSGAAIGGFAQGAGSVIGSYLDRKSERDRLKEAKRQAEREEKQQDEIRRLLMPLFEKQAARIGQRQNSE